MNMTEHFSVVDGKRFAWYKKLMTIEASRAIHVQPIDICTVRDLVSYTYSMHRLYDADRTRPYPVHASRASRKDPKRLKHWFRTPRFTKSDKSTSEWRKKLPQAAYTDYLL